MSKKAREISEDTTVGVDIDGDGKSDFSLSIKTISSVVIGIVMMVMFYYQIQSDIEEAKNLPKIGSGIYTVDPGDPQAINTYPPTRGEFKMKDEMSRLTLQQLIDKVDKIEEELDEVKVELAKKKDR
tara:strand:- start:7387 stop:7767 length:381 start_codon:yes stop_codon:yes gene_type:complete